MGLMIGVVASISRISSIVTRESTIFERKAAFGISLFQLNSWRGRKPQPFCRSDVLTPPTDETVLKVRRIPPTQGLCSREYLSSPEVPVHRFPSVDGFFRRYLHPGVVDHARWHVVEPNLELTSFLPAFRSQHRARLPKFESAHLALIITHKMNAHDLHLFEHEVSAD